MASNMASIKQALEAELCKFPRGCIVIEKEWNENKLYDAFVHDGLTMDELRAIVALRDADEPEPFMGICKECRGLIFGGHLSGPDGLSHWECYRDADGKRPFAKRKRR